MISVVKPYVLYEGQIADAVLQGMMASTYSQMSYREDIFFAVNNVDFAENTPHGTAMAIYKRCRDVGQKMRYLY